MITAPSFADALRAHRAAKRLSQLELGLRAGVSQRHISFLETGRASPGRDVVIKLCAALMLTPDASNGLLAAAGYSGAFAEHDWRSEAVRPIRDAARHILRAHTPYPAILIDLAGDVVEANPAFDAALGLLGDPASFWRSTHQGRDRNLLRLTLHPDGPAQFLVNFEQVARATIQRAIREAPDHPRLRALLGELAGFPNIQPGWLAPAWVQREAPIVFEHYQANGLKIKIFAMITTIGGHADITSGGLRIESYFPFDEPTAQIMARLAPQPA